MKIVTKGSLVASSAVMALLYPTTAALAQQISRADAPQTGSTPTSPAPDESVTDIIVTANKREQKLKDVGSTISALGKEDLARNQIRSLQDIAQAVPGLSFTTSAANTPIFTLRGVGFYDTSLAAYPTTSVYLDEAPIPFSAMTTQTAFDLERIEVLKGPQGTLFGNNSTGGAINYIAAKPTASFQAGASLSYERFNLITAEGYVSGPLSSNLLARIAVRAAHGDDWQKSYVSGDTTGKTRYFAGRILLDWNPLDTVRLQLSVNGWQDKSDPESPQDLALIPRPLGANPLEGYPLAPRNTRATGFTIENPPRGNNRFIQSALRADVDISDNATLTSLTSYIDYHHFQAIDGDGTALQNFDVLIQGPTRSFSQELRLANGPGARLRWVVGANYSHDDVADNEVLRFRDNSTQLGINFPDPTVVYRSRQKMANYAGFGNVEYSVTPAITIKAGARYTRNERTADLCSTFFTENAFFTGLSRALTGNPSVPTIEPGQCFALLPNGLPSLDPTRRKLAENNLSWQSGVNWKITPSTLLYLNVSKGYKAGSFPTLNAASTSQYVAVTQESVMAYEAGLKGDFFDRAVSFTAAAFYYDYKNKQLKSKAIDAVFGPLDILTNIPKSTVKGAEVEITARPIHGLTVNAAASYTDAKVKEFVGINGSGQVSDYAGARVPFAPKWRTSLAADYVQPISDKLEAFLGATYSTRSNDVTVIGGTGLFRIPSYQLLDLRAGVGASDDSWRFSVYGKNVTNEYYLTNSAIANDNIVGYAGRPATYGISLNVRFK